MASLLLVSGCLIALAPAANPSAVVPQEAYVNRDQTAVRSGPGHEYYATDHLDRGSRVEVYRRDMGGWLAVRPPLDSYSLVPTRQLDSTATKDVARVREAGAVAWVATRHGPVSNYKWQVKLDAGELVRVLGQEEVILFDGAERETAYRIAPPSGEFRWIHEEFVSEAPPSRPKIPVEAGGPPSVELADYRIVIDAQDATAPQSNEGSGPADAPAAESGKSWRAARRTSPAPAGSASSVPASGATSISAVPGRTAEAPFTLARSVQAPNSLPGMSEAPPTTDALQELDVLLSLIVSQPPERWDLADLRARALAMIDNGQTALERGRARLLLEKITQFAELQQRHEQIDSPARPSATGPSGSSPSGSNTAVATNQVGGGNVGPLATANPSPTAGGAPLTGPDPSLAPIGSGLAEPLERSSYDALGLLVPVHSRSRKAPPYALVDDNGQVIKYVSPSPGLNLHRYLGKRVGILGQRGYLPTLEASHVTANRVIQLDRHQR